jgi:hypothetical protein
MKLSVAAIVVMVAVQGWAAQRLEIIDSKRVDSIRLACIAYCNWDHQRITNDFLFLSITSSPVALDFDWPILAWQTTNSDGTISNGWPFGIRCGPLNDPDHYILEQGNPGQPMGVYALHTSTNLMGWGEYLPYVNGNTAYPTEVTQALITNGTNKMWHAGYAVRKGTEPMRVFSRVEKWPGFWP